MSRQQQELNQPLPSPTLTSGSGSPCAEAEASPCAPWGLFSDGLNLKLFCFLQQLSNHSLKHPEET